MTSELWEILVPTIRRIDEKPYTLKYHRVWDSKVRKITGGLTIIPPVKGQWVSPDGRLFVERMIPVRVACNEAQINEIIDMTMGHYDQLAVMAYRISDRCIIKHRESKQVD